MANPTVSIVLPAYDRPSFLDDAIRSVRAQSREDWELIVVDDGSPTAPLRPAFERAAAGDPRARLLRQDNAGGSAARNRGIAEARGAWVAFLDHDDVLEPDSLQTRLDAVATWRGAPPGMVFGQFVPFGLVDRPAAPFPETSASGDLLDQLLASTTVRTLSVVMVRRDMFDDANWFRTDLSISNDVELYYRIAERTPIVYSPHVVARKRAHTTNASSNHLQLHLEAAQIVEELSVRQTNPTPTTAKRLRERLQRHLLGAARAARASRDGALARRMAWRAVRVSPTSPKSWWRWVRCLV